uniref:Protein kinase domain-containing protein n=1 Tax=Panagrolaimus sp. ES5 TaxID=591445 RepID=A0AC34GQ08_9BILA
MHDEVLENGFSICVMTRGRQDLAFLQKMDRIAERHQIESIATDTADNLSVRSFEDISQMVTIIPRRISLPILHQLKPGDFFLVKYQAISILENGKYGDVFVVENIKSSKQFILKTHSTINNCKIFQNINDSHHPHLGGFLQNYDFFFRGFSLFSIHRETVGTLLCKNNNTGFPEKHVWLISRQLLCAISYLHNHGIIHTSIDPQHIFFPDPTQEKFDHLGKTYCMIKNPFIKLELSASAIYGNAIRQKLISNLYYRAPEVMCRRYWSKPVDIWAAGCVIFEIFAGVRLGCNNKYTTFRVINRCVGAPDASVIFWLERCELDAYLTHSLTEGVIAHEMNYKLQKAIMWFDALDVEKPFGHFLLQMIHLDPRERLPIDLMLKHAYLRRPSLHIYKKFFAS